MPHPKNRLKLTGDTHPPEVEYDLLDADDEPLEPEQNVRSFTRRYDDQPGMQLSPRPSLVMRRATPAIPFKAIALTLATAYVLGRLLRR